VMITVFETGRPLTWLSDLWRTWKLAKD